MSLLGTFFDVIGDVVESTGRVVSVGVKGVGEVCDETIDMLDVFDLLDDE